MQFRISLIGALVCGALTGILVGHRLGMNYGFEFDR